MTAKRGNSEGSIYQERTGRKRWVGSVTLPDKKRKYVYGQSRKEVADRLTAILSEVATGIPQPTTTLSTGKFLTDWLDQSVKPSRSAGTYRAYKLTIDNHVIPAIGTVPMAKVTPAHMQRLQSAMLANGLGIPTIKLTRAVLSAALTQAVKWNLLARNPVGLVDAPRGESKEPEVLSPEQAGLLIDAPGDHPFAPLYTLLASTGLRISEALGLTFDNVDFNAQALHVRQQLSSVQGQPTGLADLKSKTSRRTIPGRTHGIAKAARTDARASLGMPC